MTASQPHCKKSGNGVILWALILVVALPVVSSWVLFFNPELLPDRHSNHGILIRPQIQIADVALRKSDGSAFKVAALQGKWALMLLPDGPCAASCREWVHQLQQIRLATGKDQGRLELLMLYRIAPGQAGLSLVQDNTGWLVAGYQDTGRDEMKSALQQAGINEQYGLVVVDPMGNMIMRYPRQAFAEDILKDMRKLLRATRDWQPAAVTREKNDESV